MACSVGSQIMRLLKVLDGYRYAYQLTDFLNIQKEKGQFIPA